MPKTPANHPLAGQESYLQATASGMAQRLRHQRPHQSLSESKISPSAAWTAKPPEGKGRTVAAIVAHMHNVRVMWLKAAKAEEIPAQLDRFNLTPWQALRCARSQPSRSQRRHEARFGDSWPHQRLSPRCRGIPRVPDCARCPPPRADHHAGPPARLSLAAESHVRHVGVGLALISLRAAAASGTIQLRPRYAQGRVALQPGFRRQQATPAGIGIRPRRSPRWRRRSRPWSPLSLRIMRVEETRRAIDSGCDTIFACGGDGTIHNIAQVLANSPAALAILPMGTANALAHDLCLPLQGGRRGEGIPSSHSAPHRARPRQLLRSPGQSRHALFRSRRRRRRRRSSLLQTSHRNQAAHGHGGLLRQSLESVVQLSHDALCGGVHETWLGRPAVKPKSPN